MPGILNSYTGGGGGGGGGGGPLAMNISPDGPIVVYHPSFSGSNTTTLVGIASGGTPPYTYLWTRLSAPDGITCLDVNASMADFTATGAGGTTVSTRYELWQCQVTDNVAATATDGRWIRFIFGVEEP